MAERKTGQREAVPESGSDLHGTPGSDPRQAGRDREADCNAKILVLHVICT